MMSIKFYPFLGLNKNARLNIQTWPSVCIHMFDLETTDSVVPRSLWRYSNMPQEASFQRFHPWKPGSVAEIHTTNRVKRNMKRSGSCFLAVACYSLLFRPYLG